MTEKDYRQFCQHIETTCGIVIPCHSYYFLSSRLFSLVEQFHFPSLDALLQNVQLGSDVHLVQAVIDAMTTNETAWFRDKYPFTALGEKILPQIFHSSASCRVWSAGCAFGQEAYSIAMILDEYERQKTSRSINRSIVATDISLSALSIAREGIYDAELIKKEMSFEKRYQFFTYEKTNTVQIKQKLKKEIHFHHLNLLEPYDGLGKFDVIFCRNVLMYFSTDTRMAVLRKFISVLNPRGFLILGASESLSCLADYFDFIPCYPGIIYQLKADITR